MNNTRVIFDHCRVTQIPIYHVYYSALMNTRVYQEESCLRSYTIRNQIRASS